MKHIYKFASYNSINIIIIYFYDFDLFLIKKNMIFKTILVNKF